jgi:predicted metal-dependent phosphoesterase TrpH
MIRDSLAREKVDLHIHTWASDGKKTPEEIVAKAKAQGH